MLQQFENGLALGMAYALVALGYVLIFGVIRVINLAYGTTMMIGAFTGYVAVERLGSSLLLAFAAAAAGAVAAGLLVDRLAVRPLGKVSDPESPAHLGALITTVGAATFLENAILKLFGAQDLAYPDLLSNRDFSAGPVSTSATRAVILVMTTVLMAGLWYAVHRTRWGLAVRSATENVSAAAGLGMPVNRLQTQVVIISSALAGVAGVLIGISDRGLSPFMGVNYGLKALTALIVGGMESIPGAVVAGVLLGLVEVFAVAYWSDTYRDAIAYGVLLLVILLRPQGILGKNKVRY